MSKNFSIIVPVYNVADYIDKAVNSILLQDIHQKSYEIILVDDGSLDDCGSKCDAWASKYPETIRVLHKKNAGLGFARNSGLEMALGEYVIFLDSDDYWKNQHALSRFEKVIQKEKPDVILFKNCIFDEVSNVIKDLKKDLINTITLEKAIKQEYFDFSAWNKVVKKSLLINNDIKFKKGISEDMLWSFNILLYAKKYSFILDESIYVYRKGRAGSLTAQKCSTYREEYFQIMDDIGRLMKDNPKKREADLYASMVYFTIFRYLRNNLNLNESDTQFVKCMDRNKHMLRKCANWKIFIVRGMINSLGVKNTIKIFKKAHR